MFTADALLELHRRSADNLSALLEHCRQFNEAEFVQEHEGFGYGSLFLQFQHVIGATKYWIGVLEGRMDVDEDESCNNVERLEQFRKEVFELTENYLKQTSDEGLNTARTVTTWGDNKADLKGALVFFRCFTHCYHHQGQILAMCRLLKKPASGFDFPIK